MSFLDWDLREIPFFSQCLKSVLFLKYYHMGEVHLEISSKNIDSSVSLVSLLSQSLASEASAPIKTSPLPDNHLLMVFYSSVDPRQTGTGISTRQYSLNCLKYHSHSSFWGFCLSSFRHCVCQSQKSMTSLLQVSSSLSYVGFPHSLCSSRTFFTLLLSSGLFLCAFFFPSSFFTIAVHIIAAVWLWRETVAPPIPSLNEKKSGRRERWAAEL